MTFQKLLIAGCLCFGLVHGVPKRSRSLIFWMNARPDYPDWKDRIQNIAEHRNNLTGVAPCIHGIDAAGRFANVNYDAVAPYLPQIKALGLDVFPLIGLAGGMPGLQHVLTPAGSKAFIQSAVEMAEKMEYDGYNMDVEARGKIAFSSWSYLLPYAKPYMNFLNEFADAMHAKNKTLTVDIGGCCDWFDTVNPKNPAGHCGKGWAYAHYEFVATTCVDYANSRLDTTYAMSTYSDSVWNISSLAGPNMLKTMANHTIHHIGIEKYGLGFKGGWNVPADAADEASARETVSYLRDKLNIRHASHWADEPLTQAGWNIWGYFLHGDAEKNKEMLHV